MGNRGCLHDHAGRIARRWTTRAWIACRLEFRDRRRALMQPGRYTELFFLDEATAAAAGHRPCAECRHEDYRAFRKLWHDVHGPVRSVTEIDARLHAARIDPATRAQRRYPARWSDLPDGSFALHGGRPHLLAGGWLLPFAPAGYGPALPLPATGEAEVLTPAPLVALMRAGWRPALHPSAGLTSPPGTPPLPRG